MYVNLVPIRKLQQFNNSEHFKYFKIIFTVSTSIPHTRILVNL